MKISSSRKLSILQYYREKFSSMLLIFLKCQEQQEKLQAAREAPVNDGIQSKVLRDKLAELEAEINKFRAENANLERLRKEREEVRHRRTVTNQAVPFLILSISVILIFGE